MALRVCILRFRQRFRQMEIGSEKRLEDLQPAELEALWVDAKRKLAISALAPSAKETEPRL